jgi:hypothetical protein
MLRKFGGGRVRDGGTIEAARLFDVRAHMS